jgi:TM2 domain-containing membrane protein YozV
VALENIYDNHKSHRPKSPVLAGIMSGIIPGSGKIYAGKTGAGIASFIGTAGFGFIAWENYRKLGISHAKTIIFGSIFAFNYVSNIYGSVISVKLIENEYKNAVHNQILFQLHVPLRNFFE